MFALRVALCIGNRPLCLAQPILDAPDAAIVCHHTTASYPFPSTGVFPPTLTRSHFSPTILLIRASVEMSRLQCLFPGLLIYASNHRLVPVYTHIHFSRSSCPPPNQHLAHLEHDRYEIGVCISQWDSLE